jgi:hypothetical protein
MHLQYNIVIFFRLIRPVGNSTDRLTVKMGLKLSQIIGVDMKRQILITNVWLEQVRRIYLTHRIQQPIPKLQILQFHEFFNQADCFLTKKQ